MSAATKFELQMATSGLTGRREMDILYLKEQILMYENDTQIAKILEGILGCLVPACTFKAA